jgi:vancomycin resistance protein YoaR
MSEIREKGGASAARRRGDRSIGVAPKKKRPPRGRRAYAARRRRAMIIALATCGLLVVLVAGNHLFGGDGIHRGVEVGGLDVGTMSREVARQAIERQASATFEKIAFGSEGFSVSGEGLGVKVDATSAVEEAYSVGREGWVLQRVFDVLRAYVVGVQVDTEIEYDQEAARVAVEDLAREFYRAPQDATFRVTVDGRIEVEEAENGRVLDKEATLANLDRALANLSAEVPLAADHPKPDVTSEEIDQLKPQKVIGEFRTDFLWDSNPDRKANMKLAAEAVNNTVLAPGEVFSFNELTRTLDYEKAKTFSDGGIGFANGGGLCQVSSTLYMAAQYAGLEIVERYPHFAVLPYIKPGFDATVWFGENGWGEQDMKFKNTTDGYVVIREWVDEKGFLNAQIVGRPTGKKVEMRTEKIWERSQVGIKWATYKKVTDKNGKVLFDSKIYDYIYGYNPPVPEGVPHYDTSAPRVSGWADPTNTTGWANVE